MVQKHLLNLYPARTAWMLSGARRVAMTLLMMMLTMTAQTAWAQQINIHVLFTFGDQGNLDDENLDRYENGGLSVTVNGQSVSREGNSIYYTATSLAGQKNTISVELPDYLYVSNATYNYIGSDNSPVENVPMTYEGSEYKWSFTIAEDAISSQKRIVDITINIGDVNSKYIVFFDANGGTGAMEYLIMDPSSTQNLPTCTFSRDGYTFLGWATSPSGSGVYADNAKITAGEFGTQTLYAKWFNNSAQMNTYTVTLNQQEGSGGTESVTATYGADMPAITVPTKTGYDFNGYYTETNGGGTQFYNADGSSARTWNITDNTTLYANWTAKQYTVTLDHESGENGSYEVTATYGAAMPAITLPTKTGYTFGGYFTEPCGNGTQYYNANGTSARTCDLTAAVTLYAKWTANTYTVALDHEGGSGGSNEVTATYGAAMPAITLPTKTGYDFDGYYTETNGGGTQYYNADGSSARSWGIDANTTLHAHWKKCLSNTEITIEIPAQTYSGSQLTPVVTVKDNGSEVSDAHYTISLPEGRTNAGDYTINIEAKEGSTAYVGSKTATFTINKASLTVTAKNHSIYYGNEAANNGVTYDGFVEGENQDTEGIFGTTTLSYAYKTANDITSEDYTTSSPAGTYYIIPSGLTATNYNITFVSGTLTVEPVPVKFSVVDIANGEELEGAIVQVIEKKDENEEEVVEEWTSTTEIHMIEGLKTGVEYTLRETVAPEGYTVATDITFTIDESGKVTTTGTITEDGVLLVENSKTQVNICVVDIADGEELEGAHVQVIDSENNVVVEWDSTTEPHEIDGLNTGEEYTVHETVAPDGYTIPTDFTFTIGTDGRITTSGSTTTDEDGLTVLLVENERTGNLKVSNTVYADNNEDEFTFTVTLDDETINGTYVDMTFTDGEATVTLKGGESATATGLPTSLNYTVSQTGIEGYRLDGESSYSGAISTTTSEVTFTYIQLVNVKVTKVWDDSDNQDGKRPDDVTVNLLADGRIIETVTLSEENSWTYTWTNLDKYNGEGAIDYTVTEEAVAEYTTNITKADDGTFTYTVTNSHETEETEVKVTKVWDDSDNQDGYRPADVVINLLADGKIIDTVTLSEENEWNYSWTKLDKKANGNDIDYTVTENAVDEYTTNITKATDGTFTYTVTNTHVLVTSGYCGATGSETSVTWNYNTDTKTLSISGAGYMMTYDYVQGAGNSAPWKAFANEMKSVTIGNGVTTIGQNAFRTCTGLTSVTIGSSVTYICSSAFYGCTGLTTVTIPASVTTIDPGAFYGCTGLTTVTLNRYVPSNEKPITALEYGRGFNGCDNLKLILVPNEDAYNAYYSNADWQAHQAKLAPQTLSVAKNASGWGTYCHNYPVSYSLSNDATAYEVAGLSQDGKSVTIAQADDNLVAPRTPLLLSYSGEGNVTLTAVPTTATTLSSTDALVSTTGTGWAFYGTTTALETIPDANYSAGLTYVLYGDKFLKSDNNSGIAANRCWLKLEAGGDTSGARLLSIVIDDNPTAIDNVQWSMVNGQSDSWYTIDGRKLNGKPTKKGLYIYNGKKVAIK